MSAAEALAKEVTTNFLRASFPLKQTFRPQAQIMYAC